MPLPREQLLAAGYSPEEVDNYLQRREQAAVPTFMDNLTGGTGGAGDKIGQFGSDIWDAVKGVGRSLIPPSPFSTEAIQAARDFSNKPLNEQTNQVFQPLLDRPLASDAFLPMGMGETIPGTRTAEIATSRAIQGSPMSWGDAGTSLRQDLASGLVQGGIMGGTYLAGRAMGNSAARTTAETAALADPASQAAIRFGQNQGYYDTPNMKADLASGSVSQEMSDMAALAQQKAKASYVPSVQEGMGDIDYAPALAAGEPESSASTRPFAASEATGAAGNTLIESNLFTGNGTEKINPQTGKFPPPAPGSPPTVPMADTALMQKAQQAAIDTIKARKSTVQVLDAAHDALLKEGPSVPRITWKTSIAPMLDDLGQVIKNRDTVAQTVPMSQSMMTAYQKLKESFSAMNSNQAFALTPSEGLSSLGLPSPGEVTMSQSLGMLESMNAFRRAVGEFDESTRAARLNSTFSDTTGRAAELYSMTQVQHALQTAMEGKATEILQAAPTLKAQSLIVNGQEVPTQILQSIQPDSLAIMNKTYGAMQTYAEALLTRSNTTRRGMVTPEQGRFITAQKEGTQTATQQAAQLVKQGIVGTITDKIGLTTPPRAPNLAGQADSANLRRINSASSQVLDTLLLRDKPVPLISRDWESVKMDQSQFNQVAMMSVALGLLPMGVFNTLSDPIKQEVHKQIATIAPQAMQSVPGGLNIVNGQFNDPTGMEKESHMKDALGLDLENQARIMSAAYENKYIPRPSAMAQVALKGFVQAPNLPTLNKSIGETLAPAPVAPKFDYSYDNSTSTMLDDLLKAERLHGLN